MADVLLCCHFGLARNLSKKKLCPGVKARDKWLLDEIEEKQEKIFYGEEGPVGKEELAATDKEKKDLKTVLALVRREVENLQESCSEYGLQQLRIVTKNGGILGGWVGVQDTGLYFAVEKKKKQKKKMAITVERRDSKEDCKKFPMLNSHDKAQAFCKESPIVNSLVKARVHQAAQAFTLTIPLRCGLNCSGASCHPRLKEARWGYFGFI